MNNDFPSVFIDNDKPELVFDYTKEECPKPEPPKPRDYCRRV